MIVQPPPYTDDVLYRMLQEMASNFKRSLSCISEDSAVVGSGGQDFPLPNLPESFSVQISVTLASAATITFSVGSKDYVWNAAAGPFSTTVTGERSLADSAKVHIDTAQTVSNFHVIAQEV